MCIGALLVESEIARAVESGLEGIASWAPWLK